MTAPTTGGTAEVYLSLLPSGGSEVILLGATLFSDQNAVGDHETQALGTSIILLPGDLLRFFTYDSSTGGTINYRCGWKITEFDA
jgi:hypothetical protein